MRSLKNEEGFTLLESLLVLLCLAVFFTVPLFGLKTWREQTEVTHFFNQLERNIQMTHQSAIIEAQTTMIDQKTQTQKLGFTYFHHSRRIKQDLEVKSPLILRSNETITFNTTTGNIKKLEKIKIEDHLNQRVVTYSFQLGSGKVIRSESKL